MTDLLDLTNAQLTDLLTSWGEPAYRARQIEHWIYREFATDPASMSNLPLHLRTRLSQTGTVSAPVTVAEAASEDQLTRKVLLRLADGATVETVLMLYEDAPGSPETEVPTALKRRSVCISTQVGCPIGCPFCATGQAGFVRNLTPGEIVAQVLHWARALRPEAVTNVVLMGMGEPFMKFDVTWRAVQSLVAESRLGLGARRITISTSGEVDGIRRLERETLRVNLAISLHAPDDALRDRLVPLNRKYPLRELIPAARHYAEKTRRRVTFEYALMEGVNDSPDQARGLARLLGSMLCHVNLIPLNPTADSTFRRTPYGRVKQFQAVLAEAGIPTTLRVEKGIEISAGCGQLRQAVS